MKTVLIVSSLFITNATLAFTSNDDLDLLEAEALIYGGENPELGVDESTLSSSNLGNLDHIKDSYTETEIEPEKDFTLPPKKVEKIVPKKEISTKENTKTGNNTIVFTEAPINLTEDAKDNESEDSTPNYTAEDINSFNSDDIVSGSSPLFQ